MLKKVKITVTSATRAEDEQTPERTVEKAEGYMKYDKSGVSLVSFKTKSEGGEFTTEVFREEGGVRLLRRGAITSEIIFEKGKAHTSLYRVPPLSFDLTVKTRALEFGITENGGTLTLVYSMDIGGAQRLAKMDITVKTV